MTAPLHALIEESITSEAREFAAARLGFAERHGMALHRGVRRRRAVRGAATTSAALVTVGAVAWGASALPWNGARLAPAASDCYVAQAGYPVLIVGDGEAVAIQWSPLDVGYVTQFVDNEPYGATAAVRGFDAEGNEMDGITWEAPSADGPVQFTVMSLEVPAVLLLHWRMPDVGTASAPAPSEVAQSTLPDVGIVVGVYATDADGTPQIEFATNAAGELVRVSAWDADGEPLDPDAWSYTYDGTTLTVYTIAFSRGLTWTIDGNGDLPDTVTAEGRTSLVRVTDVETHVTTIEPGGSASPSPTPSPSAVAFCVTPGPSPSASPSLSPSPSPTASPTPAPSLMVPPSASPSATPTPTRTPTPTPTPTPTS